MANASIYSLLELARAWDIKLNTAQQVMQHVLGVSLVELRLEANKALSLAESEQIKDIFRQLSQGKPLGYIINTQHFWDFELYVSCDVLLPRFDTERLVEHAINLINNCSASTQPFKILDLCTGSGAIAIALAKECKNVHIDAVDICPKALLVAQKNLDLNHISNVNLIQSDLFEKINLNYDFIITNPPYIAANSLEVSPEVIAYEPHIALFSAENGFWHIKQIIQQADKYLNNAGYLLIEHGFNQQAGVLKLFSQYGFNKIQTAKDYCGHDRLSWAQK